VLFDASNALNYDFDGTGQFDIVPANVIPPTIQCTGCAIGEGVRSFGDTTFNVGYVGRMSTFSPPIAKRRGREGCHVHEFTNKQHIGWNRYGALSKELVLLTDSPDSTSLSTLVNCMIQIIRD
jgi:hypothetical protein